ncbi:hypothetical protein ACWELB_20800 [Streptomyces asiaticus]
MTALSAADQARAFRALAALADTTPGLPAARIVIEGHITLAAELTVRVGAHGEPDTFEAWRTALNIDPDSLEQHQMMGGAWVTSGHALFHGVMFVLSLYHQQPAPAPVAVLAGAA